MLLVLFNNAELVTQQIALLDQIIRHTLFPPKKKKKKGVFLIEQFKENKKQPGAFDEICQIRKECQTQKTGSGRGEATSYTFSFAGVVRVCS